MKWEIAACGILAVALALTCLSSLQGHKVVGELYFWGIQSPPLSRLAEIAADYERVTFGIVAALFCILLVRILSKLNEPRHRILLIFGMASVVILVLSSISLRSEFGEQVTALAGLPKALLVLFLIPIFNHPLDGVSTLKRFTTAFGFAFGSVATIFMLYGLFESSSIRTGTEFLWKIPVAGCYAAWAAISYEVWRKVATARTKVAAAAVVSYILLALAIFSVYLILVVGPR